MYEDFFTARLATLREQKKVSARDMSLSLGQNPNYINQIENKKTLPSMQVFFYICEYLGITPKEFFDDETQNPAGLKALLADMGKLDDTALAHLHGVVKQMIGTGRN